MLSALVLAPPFSGTPAPASRPLVRTLAALVPATVEGLVRDVVLLSRGSDESIRAIAEHAGCRHVEAASFEAAFAEGLTVAKSSMIFVIRAGAAFDRGFLDEIAAVLAPDRDQAEAPAYLLRQAPEGLATRILPDLAPVAGIIAPRTRLTGTVRDFAWIVRRLGKGRRFGARAVMAA